MAASPAKLRRILVILLALAAPAAASDVRELFKELIPVPAVTANEEKLSARVAALLPKGASVEKDTLGALYVRLGSSEPELAVLAPLDEFGYAVSGITSDGYLRLDRGVPPPLAVADSFLLGRSVLIATRSGTIPGVVCQPALHLMTAESREKFAKLLSLDLVYVDIGAHSEEEARAMGVEVLNAVSWPPDPVLLAHDRWAGPGFGRKAVCAALIAASRELAQVEGVSARLVWMAQTRFLVRRTKASLAALRARNKLEAKAAVFVDIVAADRGPGAPVFGQGPVVVQAQAERSQLGRLVEEAASARKLNLQHKTEEASPLLAPYRTDSGQALILALPVRYAGTPAEVVDMKDVQNLTDLLVDIVKKGRLS